MFDRLNFVGCYPMFDDVIYLFVSRLYLTVLAFQADVLVISRTEGRGRLAAVQLALMNGSLMIVLMA